MQILQTIAKYLSRRLLTDAGVFAFLDEVTPNDSGDIPNGPARGLLVKTAGTLTVELMSSDEVTRTTLVLDVVAKDILPLAVYRVMSTGTSAVVYAGW